MTMQIELISALLGIIISLAAITVGFSRFLYKTFKKNAIKIVNEIKVSDLNPNSDLVKSMGRAKSYRNKLDSVIELTNSNSDWIKLHEKEYAKLITSISEMKKSLLDAEMQRFKSDLRNRLEYVIGKKGSVDRSYWESIVTDYDRYINEFHLNSYIKSLYAEAEDLYIDANIKS